MNDTLKKVLENADVFFERVDDSGACHVWKLTPNAEGYGHWQFRRGGRKYKIRAHRAAYMIEHRRMIYPTEVVMHSCDNPICVNPRHLRLGTHAANNADKVAKGRHATGVDHGHAKLTPKDVHEIRERFGNLVREESNNRGVDRSAIEAVCSGETWSFA